MRITDRRGMTLIEMLVVIVIIGILASAVLPLSRMSVKRIKEAELREALRTIRSAIDAFNRDCTARKISVDLCTRENYPETLETLLEPARLAGSQDKTRKYLRRIPRDPMVRSADPALSHSWGLRSIQDRPDSMIWGGENVYDVFSKSDQTALDGSPYSTW